MKNLGKIKFNFVLNIILFLIYYVTILNQGLYGLFVLTLIAFLFIVLGYFVLFAIALWVDMLKYFMGIKDKKKVSHHDIDTRPIIEQLDEVFGKRKK